MGTELIPLVLGVLFMWTGGAKALSGSLVRQATDSALHRLLGDVGRTTVALRALGWCELALGIGLVVAPGARALAAATVLLGAGFLGYLTYAKVKAPGSSCGCAASRSAPVTWRAFARAGLVVGGGLLAAGASAPWWTTVSTHPVAATVFLLASGLLLLALSADLDRWWLLPSRAIWLRVVGHPLAVGRHTGNGTREVEDVPVAASVELLEQSLAWQAAAPLVRFVPARALGRRRLASSGVRRSVRRGGRPAAGVGAVRARHQRDDRHNPPPGDPGERGRRRDAGTDPGRARRRRTVATG